MRDGMTPHPQGNGKPGDVAESEREKAVVRAAQKWGDTDAADVVEMLAAELELSNALVALGAVTVEPVFHLRSYGDVSAAELGGVQHSGKRSAEVNCKLDMDQGARAAALAEEMTQSDLDKYASELIWLRDAFAAASPPPQSAQLIEPKPISDEQLAARFTKIHRGPNPYYACNECGESIPGLRDLLVVHVSTHGVPVAGSGLMEGKDADDDSKAEAIATCLMRFASYTKNEARACSRLILSRAYADAALSQGQQTEQGSRNG